MGKLLIVSGGSKGLGQALVQQALDAGWQVLECSRSGDTLQHASLCHLPLDLAQLDGRWQALAEKFAQLAQESWQQVVLVNNAAMVGPIAPVGLLSESAMQTNMAVNFSSGISLMALFVRTFQALAANKVLINISSGAALKGYPSWALYCAAKAGTENFVRSVAEEQKDQAAPIACVNFGPGVIDTDMQVEIRETPDHLFRDVARFRQLKDEQQLRTPANVANALLRLMTAPVENGRRYTVDEFDA